MDPSFDASSHPRSADAWGLAGVLAFSLTLPAIRMTVGSLDPIFVALGRAIPAAALASVFLLHFRAPGPRKQDWPSLVLVALGSIFGFPLLTTIALQHLPASHGAVVIALLPLASAGGAALFVGERHSSRFWIGAFLGSLGVAAFALRNGSGFANADGLLLLAVLFAATSYVSGGRLARSLGGWQVIAWALILALPMTLTMAWLHRPLQVGRVSAQAWIGFGYLSVFSAFLGFVAWYRGLAKGGIARVGQLQLLQPFFTLAWSFCLLREPLAWTAIATPVWVLACVVWGRGGLDAKKFTPN